MPNDFYGLPLHPLIVHATVVIIPLAALTALLTLLLQRFREWAGWLPAGLSLVGLILVPLSTSTGETLEEHVRETALLESHSEMAEGLLPWMIGLTAMTLISYVVHRRSTPERPTRQAVSATIAILVVLSVVGTTVQVARIGHSGAESAWQDTDMGSSSTR